MYVLHQIAAAGQGAWPIDWLLNEATDHDLAAILHILDERNDQHGR